VLEEESGRAAFARRFPAEVAGRTRAGEAGEATRSLIRIGAAGLAKENEDFLRTTLGEEGAESLPLRLVLIGGWGGMADALLGL
jgi:hypothetical protein